VWQPSTIAQQGSFYDGDNSTLQLFSSLMKRSNPL
jgi:hypothetical protein